MALDKVEREVIIKAPIAKVWKSLTDHKEFGKWFQVSLDQPFEVGKDSTGHMLIPGYEQVKWTAKVLKMVPNKLFSFSGPPYVEDTNVDLAKEPWLITEFTLQEIPEGTLVKVVESGFAKLSPSIRSKAKTGNKEGWKFQMDNLLNYAEENQQ